MTVSIDHRKGSSEEEVINRIEMTSDTLTSRGGLSLFVRYLRNIELAPHLERLFGTIRKSAKGQVVAEAFKQPGNLSSNLSSNPPTYQGEDKQQLPITTTRLSDSIN